MIKKLLLLTVLFTALVFPQTEQQNPNVELPDFVITGTDILSVKWARKIDPELVSTLSEETFKPVFSAEELEMGEISNPVKEELNLFDSLNFYYGKIKAGAGFYTLPVAEIRYGIPFSSGLFEAFAGGKNIRSYVPNSSRYNALGGINLNFFTSQNAVIIPGSQFRFHGDYGTSAFKFYAFPNLTEKREINNGTFSFDFNSLIGRGATAGLKFQDDYSQIKDESFSEHFFTTEGFFKVNISSFNIGASAKYDQQMLSGRLGDFNSYLVSVRPFAGFTVSRTLRASVGLTYSKAHFLRYRWLRNQAEDENFLSLYAAMSLRINKNFSLYAEFSPSAELYGPGYFLSRNRFFDVSNYVNFYSEETINFSGTLKYEFDKYFQLDGGVRYKSADNIPYFVGNTDYFFYNGRFKVFSADASIITGFANFLFHRGPYGRFYGTAELNFIDAELQKISEEVLIEYGDKLPYYPYASASLTYGYYFGTVADLQTTAYYTSDVYTDVSNTEKIDAYVDLRAYLGINLNKNLTLFFEANNLLNRSNYIWKGYKETPLDFLGGIVFRW